MNFKFLCPACNQSISADSEWSGQTANCPTCSESFVIPFSLQADTSIVTTQPLIPPYPNPMWERLFKMLLLAKTWIKYATPAWERFKKTLFSTDTWTKTRNLVPEKISNQGGIQRTINSPIKSTQALILGALILIPLTGSLIYHKIADRNAQMKTLNGRITLISEEPYLWSLHPEFLNGTESPQRIKIHMRVNQGILSKKDIRRGVMEDIRKFMVRFYETGTSEEVVYFWFSPETTLVDSFGNDSEGPIGKFVITPEIADQANWENMTAEQVEKLFSSECTYDWHRAIRDN